MCITCKGFPFDLRTIETLNLSFQVLSPEMLSCGHLSRGPIIIWAHTDDCELLAIEAVRQKQSSIGVVNARISLTLWYGYGLLW